MLEELKGLQKGKRKREFQIQRAKEQLNIIISSTGGGV